MKSNNSKIEMTNKRTRSKIEISDQKKGDSKAATTDNKRKIIKK